MFSLKDEKLQLYWGFRVIFNLKLFIRRFSEQHNSCRGNGEQVPTLQNKSFVIDVDLVFFLGYDAMWICRHMTKIRINILPPSPGLKLGWVTGFCCRFALPFGPMLCGVGSLRPLSSLLLNTHCAICVSFVRVCGQHCGRIELNF